MTQPINWNKAQPGLLILWDWVSANFPKVRFLGIYVKRNIAGTTTPSPHAEGRALDIGVKVGIPDEEQIGDFLFALFRINQKELGLDHVIWNKKIWYPGAKKVEGYTGRNPHTDHVHVALTRTGSQKTEFPDTLKRLQDKKIIY